MNRRSSGPLIVEFISTPGAGKTSLLPAVKGFFSGHDRRAWGVIEAARPFAQRTTVGRIVSSLAPVSLRGPLLWQVFYLASRMERAKFRSANLKLIHSVEHFQRERPISPADQAHVMRWFTNLTGQYSFLKAHAGKEDVLIFDEGFIHRVVQLFASEAEMLEPDRIRSYLDQVPLPDLIIQPQASLETCLTRVYQRGIWERFQARDKGTVRRFMQNAHAAVGIAVEHIAARRWPLVQVDNESQPAAESARQLREKLTSIYTTARDNIPVPMNV